MNGLFFPILLVVIVFAVHVVAPRDAIPLRDITIIEGLVHFLRNMFMFPLYVIQDFFRISIDLWSTATPKPGWQYFADDDAGFYHDVKVILEIVSSVIRPFIDFIYWTTAKSIVQVSSLLELLFGE